MTLEAAVVENDRSHATVAETRRRWGTVNTPSERHFIQWHNRLSRRTHGDSVAFEIFFRFRDGVLTEVEDARC